MARTVPLKEKGIDNPFRTKTEQDLAYLSGKYLDLDKRLTYIESLASQSSHNLTHDYDDCRIVRDSQYCYYTVYGPKGEHIDGLSDVRWMSIEQAKSAWKNYKTNGHI